MTSSLTNGGRQHSSTIILEENGNNTEAEDNRTEQLDNGNQETEEEEEFPLCLVFGLDSWQDGASFQELLTQIEESGQYQNSTDR